ncbi:methylmalonyl Co-A mutase-associated GTPase MeaB [Flavobacterium silvaticum]|uniref:Methylmalonyl Co-A mutase-associated GTPase MeaB n=1 Tax=Flavobacterium silvaticum TaxID=1852020 RepID=A0A972FVB7_9FLAO|nr:methylmalonyl Co-A mutase-associated GTPase MeaB [Flavobacterium silvaticum]NMH29303.1 methylmalonyl Co-A mutase-associated GTPase MeaB [Flavobacterium silvaticum]
MEPEKKTSALQEIKGVESPDSINPKATSFVGKNKFPSANEFTEGIFSGNITYLSRAITVIESTNPAHSDLASQIITACLPKSGNSIRIGITGVPGVGKSTFIEAFGKHLTALGKKVAVLAVDPSSSISHGSILGDKTRMEELVKDENAYIRPSASGKTLGGVARSTRETITLCEAFGFDVIIIETVGVGQSETAVHAMTDFFLLLKISGAGDELQGIKRGIMEMADLVVINKADGDNIKKAKLARTEFERALHFFPPQSSGWTPKALTASAVTHDGIPEVWETISDYVSLTESNGYFLERRNLQDLEWLSQSLKDRLLQQFELDANLNESLEQMKKKVLEKKISPFIAASRLLEDFLKGRKP